MLLTGNSGGHLQTLTQQFAKTVPSEQQELPVIRTFCLYCALLAGAMGFCAPAQAARSAAWRVNLYFSPQAWLLPMPAESPRYRFARMTAGDERIDDTGTGYLDGRSLSARALAYDIGSFELSRCRPLLPGLAIMRATEATRLWIAPGWLLNSSGSPQESFRGNFRTRRLGLWVRYEF